MPEIAIILPAYNEAKRLENTVSRIIEEMDGMAIDGMAVSGMAIDGMAVSGMAGKYEIIIAEDGSKDGTDAIAEKLHDKYSFVKHLHSAERAGRGRALNRSFASTDASIVLYCDVDLATDTKHMKQLIDAIRNGYDIATGSRLMKDSDVKRPFNREFASRGYNSLVRMMLRSKLYDHQCGFKAFNRKTIMPMLSEVKDTHWFWDTELLVRAQRKGMKVYEFPVYWRHGGATKVDLKRDVLYMGSRVFKLWLEFLKN
jgi:glycosyltransferase involved in cell wall biosynthesis